MEITIYTNYDEALNIAQKENKSLFILFTKDKCKWCKKVKSMIFNNKPIVKILQKEYIVII